MRFAIFIFAALLLAVLAWWLCFSPAAMSAALPDLPKQWDDQVYGLDDQEVIRLVAPPFPPQRASRLLAAGQLTGQTMHLVRANGLVDPISWTSKTGTVRSALANCIDLPEVEARVAARAGNVAVDGDWIVREQTPNERRMRALAGIFDSVTAGKIEIVSNSIPAYCVVVQGSWNPPGKTGDGSAPLRFDTSVAKDAPGTTQGDPKDLLRILEQNCRCRFFDETTDRPKIISWLDDIPVGVWDAYQRRNIFRTLESQSSLKFTETRRAIPIWTVRERATGRQPMTKPTTKP